MCHIHSAVAWGNKSVTRAAGGLYAHSRMLAHPIYMWVCKNLCKDCVWLVLGSNPNIHVKISA